MKMTLAKLLKHKKRVVEKISRISSKVVSINSVLSGNKRDSDVGNLLEERSKLVDYLVGLKQVLSEANAPMVWYIYKISELKGFIAFLKTIPTKDGLQPADYREKNESYEAYLKDNDVQKLVDQSEAEIDEYQERLDSFNYVTSVDIPDSPVTL